ncbi:NAD(P)-binding protein [Basidiobolus meristosporus CBS 931.73]|uniref:NAD(P)-binding protein n=1 Tax=Basidiobolus meristosporus CBS 931.73 TaxID=1314790 RepID=A0A1Y1YNA3_9FUNG|nr:NAD(P)-binding protein [Basidiobolus meristosporus CBS 931.73]|eukprot:ORX99246.1 NAD(P)-binding protein [Basidiobolus meristosporus CBS 931.73]
MSLLALIGFASSVVLFSWAKGLWATPSPRLPPNEERVVIIGASSGLGKSLALKYAKRGARLIICARREAQLMEVKEECLSLGTTSAVEYVVADVTLKDDLEKVKAISLEKLGGIDTLVLCSGVISVLPFVELIGYDDVTQEVTKAGEDACANVTSSLSKIMDINFTGPVLATTILLPTLNQIAGAPSRSLYSASKHALNGFFDSLSMEVEKYGVHVCLVCPGTIDTDLRSSAVDLKQASSTEAVHGSKKGKLSPEAVAQRVIEASDAREREVILPFKYLAVQWLKLLAPGLIIKLTKKKYGFQ